MRRSVGGVRWFEVLCVDVALEVVAAGFGDVVVGFGVVWFFDEAIGFEVIDGS